MMRTLYLPVCAWMPLWTTSNDGEDAIQYAEAAHVVSTLIDDSVARLDLVRIRPHIEELKRGSKPDDGTTLRDSASELYKLEDTCKIYCT